MNRKCFGYAKKNMFSYDVAHLSFRIPNFCQIVIKRRGKYVSGAFAFRELPFGFHKKHGLNTHFIMFPFRILFCWSRNEMILKRRQKSRLYFVPTEEGGVPTTDRLNRRFTLLVYKRVPRGKA